MVYENQIGVKFDVSGAALPYPGNTVICDIGADNAAYGALTRAREELIYAGLGEYFIFMPCGSFHMTVIRGLNDRGRKPENWPSGLDIGCSLTEADEYVYRAAASVDAPGDIRMRFVEVVVTRESIRVVLEPADGGEASKLRAYRDGFSKALGLRLPAHDAYVFHVTLGYTRILPEKDITPALGRVNRLLAAEKEFSVSAPHVAFYRDMLSFSPNRIPR